MSMNSSKDRDDAIQWVIECAVLMAINCGDTYTIERATVPETDRPSRSFWAERGARFIENTIRERIQHLDEMENHYLREDDNAHPRDVADIAIERFHLHKIDPQALVPGFFAELVGSPRYYDLGL